MFIVVNILKIIVTTTVENKKINIYFSYQNSPFNFYIRNRVLRISDKQEFSILDRIIKYNFFRIHFPIKTIRTEGFQNTKKYL